MRRAPSHAGGTLRSGMDHDDHALTVYRRLLSDRAEEALRDLEAIQEVSRRAASLKLPSQSAMTFEPQPAPFLLK